MDYDDSLLAEAEAEASTSQDQAQPSPSPPPLPPPILPTRAAAAPLQQSTLFFNQLQPSSYLPSLNPHQLKAVTAPLGSLQILAGPGSGKTKVLTTRVAYLLQHYKIPPEDLVVVTFTNKAAAEMKHRLQSIVGSTVVDKVVMGTFHSVCVRFLRKHGKLISLPNNFIIADREDCLSMIKRAIITCQLPEDLRKDLKHTTIGDVISKCKAKGITPGGYRNSEEGTRGDWAGRKVGMIARVYEEYENELAKDNALDFDDLLLRGLELFTKFPRVIANVKQVLIDEFQDTNSCQYDLVKTVARKCQCLCIVGDPDQSIYGWRSAEVENLDKMVTDFRPVTQIYLETNYRSTGAILGAALAVIKQDTKRINKGLLPSHTTGSSLVLHHAPDATTESLFIAAQIKHLVAHCGGLLDYGDFAVLLRYGAISRNVEVALQKAGIPSRMVGGHKFFERVEVKDLISYLQLVDNPSYTSAFTRIINVPKRQLGDKTIRDLLAVAKLKGLTAFEMAVKCANGSGLIKGLTSNQRNGLRRFVEVVRDVRKAAEEGESVADLIDRVCDLVSYRAHLEKTQGPDAKERFLNIEELKAYATTVAEEHPEGLPGMEDDDDEMDEILIPPFSTSAQNDDDDDGIEIIEPNPDDSGYEEIVMGTSSQISPKTNNPLRTFLAVSMLATDAETEDSKNDANARKVTLTTCHAAKGLEWPVVFVPACEDGTYPFYRASEMNEIDEERRLLYVAITRAQAFCTLTHSAVRMAGPSNKEKKLSPFLTDVSIKFPTLFVPKLQKITQKTREDMAKVLGRPIPDPQNAERMIMEHNSSLPAEPISYDYIEPLHAPSSSQGFGGNGGGFTSQGRYSGNSFQRPGVANQAKWSNNNSAPRTVGPSPIPQGVPTGFTSALSTYKSQPTVLPTPPSTGSFQRASSAHPSSTGTGTTKPKLTTTTTTSLPFNQPRLSSNGPALVPTNKKTTNNNPLGKQASLERILAYSKPDALQKLSTRDPPTATATSSSSSSSFSPLGVPYPTPHLTQPSSHTAPPPPLPPIPKPTLQPQGLPHIPETRHSLISDAVLLNPIVGEPKAKDLRERWMNEGRKGVEEAIGKVGDGGGGSSSDVEIVESGGGGGGRKPPRKRSKRA